MKILAIDIGGTHVKCLATGRKDEVKIDSGPTMTPTQMVTAVLAATKEWKYDVISIGYPGAVVHGHPLLEPANLGPGWVGFDFKKALGKPIKVVNDAAMQALGSYRGGRMLFLGLGTGLGSALIVDDVLEPMELAHLPYRKGRSYEEYVGKAGLERLGKKRWREHVTKVIGLLQEAVRAEYVVIGGGNAKLLKELPEGTTLGANENAFEGGYRLWSARFSECSGKRFQPK